MDTQSPQRQKTKVCIYCNADTKRRFKENVSSLSDSYCFLLLLEQVCLFDMQDVCISAFVAIFSLEEVALQTSVNQSVVDC